MVKKMNYSRIKTLNIFTVLCYAEDGLRECIYKKKMITYILNFKDHGKRDIFFESEVILFLNELPDIVINDLLNYVNINDFSCLITNNLVLLFLVNNFCSLGDLCIFFFSDW